MRNKTAFFALLLALGTGCASFDPSAMSNRQIENQLTTFRGPFLSELRNGLIAEAAARGHIKPENVETITEKLIRIGFNKWEVVAALGSPKDINRTVTAATTTEQWVYGFVSQYYDSMFYVYFRNGIVTSWQN